MSVVNASVGAYSSACGRTQRCDEDKRSTRGGCAASATNLRATTRVSDRAGPKGDGSERHKDEDGERNDAGKECVCLCG